MNGIVKCRLHMSISRISISLPVNLATGPSEGTILSNAVRVYTYAGNVFGGFSANFIDVVMTGLQYSRR